jgi:short-subunit dehydrogenase
MTGDSQGIAIVTGASSGIGAAIARELASRGLAVLAIARRADRLASLAAEISAKGYAPLHPLALDVTAEGAAIRVRDRARELGGAAWLVNNAGTSRIGRFAEADPQAQVALVRLNCEAVVALTAAILPDLLARGRGRIVNIASLAGFQPTPFQSVYGGTKAFVLSFTEALSEELRKTGVTATAVCPGPVTTEIFDVGAAGIRRRKPSHELSAEACARMAIAAAERGRVVAVPGLMNRLTAFSAKIFPRAMIRRVSSLIGMKYIGLELKS